MPAGDSTCSFVVGTTLQPHPVTRESFMTRPTG